MQEMMGTAAAQVDGLRACRLIGWLVLAVGLLTCGMGLEGAVFGTTAKARYEHKTGRLVRIFSDVDQTYYTFARATAAIGWLLMAGSVLPIAAGVYVVRRPRSILFVLSANK